MVPTYSRQTQIYADPAKIDEAIAFVRSSVRASVAAHAGYRSLIGGVNRMTGRVFVTSNWESVAARAGSDQALSSQRRAAADVAGATPIQVDEWEVVFVEITPAAGIELRGVGEYRGIDEQCGYDAKALALAGEELAHALPRHVLEGRQTW